MIDLDVPGCGACQIEYLILDFNGTLAIDGRLIDGVKDRLTELARVVSIIVVTADTFGTVRNELGDALCKIAILGKEDQSTRKGELVDSLGNAQCIAIGNGRNDATMLKKARVGICVVQDEGASSQAMIACDVVCLNIHDALDLIRTPLRLAATLRG